MQQPPSHRSDGFTLLELLVVLTIIAGLVAVAVPAFSEVYARVRAAFERTDLERQLQQLPQRVRISGRAGILIDPVDGLTSFDTQPRGLSITSQLERPERLRLVLPKDWTIRVPAPIFYHYNGAC